MQLADAAAGVATLALIAYGVLGGADFGGGVWDLLARGPRRDEQRRAIASAMGPVWEANHVWLIFVVVVFFTAFPTAFSAYSIALYGPLRLILVGIVLRGVSFVFRSHAASNHDVVDPRVRRYGVLFGVTSALTPALLGDALGAISTGAIRVTGTDVTVQGSPWLSPIALAMGAAAASLCAYLAAVFLCVATKGELREDFRRRALVAGTLVVAGAVATLPLTMVTAPHLWAGLRTPRALPIVTVGAVAALTSGGALLFRRYPLARLATVIQVACVIAGWAAAQYPYLLYPDVTLSAAAAPDATIRFMLYALPPGFALLLPSLWLLYRVFHGATAETATKSERGS